MAEEVKEETSNSPKTDKPWLFKPGQSGNPNGRPKNTLKDYVRQKLAGMTEEEKEAFLGKVPPEMIWKMAEGSPHQTIASDEEHPFITQVILKLKDEDGDKD
jgi:hypothetical protein